MGKEFHRADRVADAIQRNLAIMIPQEVRDPRVGMVNINEVEVTRDLSIAKVFVTLVGETDDRPCEESVDVLNKAAAFLRGLLSKELKMRVTPRLQFYYDKTAVRGQALSNLIDRAVAEDNAARDSQSDSDDSEK